LPCSPSCSSLLQAHQLRNNRIAKKTAELRKRVHDLERWNKFSTGRELKMVELKKEIKELKKKLGKKMK